MRARINSVHRALRGGSYFNALSILRVIERHWNSPVYQFGDFGFRFVIRGIR
jgi:formylglycine-generating enzyme required for sulfatase activity